jgi:hypothetical protein
MAMKPRAMNKPKKAKMMRGGAVAKDMAKPAMMRGGGVAKDMTKTAMMRGGMAKNKKK